MRKPDPLPVPQHLIDQATLYAPSRDPLDAVCYVLNDYPKLVADIRHLRRRLADLDQEGADMDVRIEALQSACVGARRRPGAEGMSDRPKARPTPL
ncbi:hypothetical protein [Pseudomonas aeruginosa]|uniref:hypothetical protein n=1 Tax=Pseudomonas aeruginosa TaxID=287 RepID=UPI00177B7C45|nr:hypothetical protein [Pseudomonas aeruginosa]